MTGYTAFLLPATSRKALLSTIPPAYPRIAADHITHHFNTKAFGDLFHPRKIEITGIADDGHGLQALVVKIDGRQYRPDGNPYHITWSLDPAKDTPPEYGRGGKYRPVHSNDLVKAVLDGNRQGYRYTPIDPPLTIRGEPALILPQKDRGATIKKLPPGPGTPSAPPPSRR